jgi:hypothetical protein
MDYGYGLIIDGCGCVDLWTIWIWFVFLMLWIKQCCECGWVDLWTMDYGLWIIWIWFHFLMLWVWVCGLVDYELFEYGLIFWYCECRGLRGVLIVDLCFEFLILCKRIIACKLASIWFLIGRRSWLFTDLAIWLCLATSVDDIDWVYAWQCLPFQMRHKICNFVF